MSDTSISIDATLPMDWENEALVSSSVLEQRRQSNISLLRALAVVESVVPENDDIPESVRKGLERVESKLDVLLMLVAQLTLDNSALPPDCEISLSQDCVTWRERSPKVPDVGQALRIRLFLSPRIPQPLTVQAVVSNNVSGQISAKLTGFDEELDEWLTRTIFRYHRRAVHARKQP